MNHYFITGTSSGIGEAIAYALLDTNNKLLCLSRRPNDKLVRAAKEASVSLTYIQADLAQVAFSSRYIDQWLDGIASSTSDKLCLIHNAGVLAPIGAVGGGEERMTQITTSNRVNFLSPVLMSERFVERTQDWEIRKQLLVISSGAARKAYESWSSYCSTKAGLEMFVACLAKEQEARPYPIRAVSLAPGVVDTPMQGFIREHTVEQMPSVERFIGMKNNGQLWSAAHVAEGIKALLAKPAFGSEVILDLRNMA